MRILIAPDSFKGSAGAGAVAEALADGWRSVRGDDIVLLPLADGGEGTLTAIATSGDWRWRRTDVPGPDGRPVTAGWLMDGTGRAFIELAESSGIALMSRLDPWAAGTRGLGAVIAAALDAGATALQVGLGGSASTDGGAGALRQLGLEAFDADDRPIAEGAHGLRTVARVDADGLAPLPAGGVELLADTDAALCGPRGAAAIFGPQKGATGQDVAALDDGLRRWVAALSAAGFDVDPARPGAGAAGGAGFGLMAWGAGLVSGSQRIAALTGLHTHLAAADVVLTGEGRFDATSLSGKLVGHVLSAAATARTAAVVVAGQVSTDSAVPTLSLAQIAGSADAALAEPLHWLRTAGAWAARVARPLSSPSSPHL